MSGSELRRAAARRDTNGCATPPPAHRRSICGSQAPLLVHQQHADAFLYDGDVGVDGIVVRVDLALQRIDLDGDFHLAGLRGGVAFDDDLIAVGQCQRRVLGVYFLIVEQQADAHLAVFKAGRVDDHLVLSWALTGTCGDGEVEMETRAMSCLAVARCRFAERERMNRAGCLRQRPASVSARELRAVVRAVAEHEQAEKRLLAGAGFVNRAQHDAEVGAFAVRFAEFVRLDLAGFLGEAVIDKVDLLLVR